MSRSQGTIVRPQRERQPLKHWQARADLENKNCRNVQPPPEPSPEKNLRPSDASLDGSVGPVADLNSPIPLSQKFGAQRLPKAELCLQKRALYPVVKLLGNLCPAL
jgi:hypothetical protein